MKIQAIRKNGHFFIPDLDNMDIESDQLVVEIDERNILNKYKTYSEEYVKKHWRDFAYTAVGFFQDGDDSNGNIDDEYLKEEYGRYLHEKNNF